MARMAIDIRSVLIPLTGERVLLPNATVAEVITYSTPEAVPDAPPWVMGRVVWRGWWVPVFSLPMLGGWAARENEAGAKIAVLKALGGNPDMPFMAMVTQGFPRLVTVTADSLQVVNGSAQDAGPGEDEGIVDDSVEASAAPGNDDFQEEAFSPVDLGVELDDMTGPGDSDNEADAEAETDADIQAEDTAGVGAENASRTEDDDFNPTAATVIVSGERAVIPDLVPIERRVARAVGPDLLKRRR